MKGPPSVSKKRVTLFKRGSRPEAAIFYCGEGVGLRGKNTVCFLAQRQKISYGRIRSGQSEVRRVIAKLRQSGESPERSSSPLVVVVCTYAARLPIQLSKDANAFLMIDLADT